MEKKLFSACFFKTVECSLIIYVRAHKWYIILHFKPNICILQRRNNNWPHFWLFAYFQFDHFTKSKIDSESRFEMRMTIFLFKFFFGAFWSVFKKVKKNDFPLYFQKVMLLWQGSIVEIDYGFVRVFGPYFIGKSLGTFEILIFVLWSFIWHPIVG